MKQETEEAVNGNGQVKDTFSENVPAKRVRTTPIIPMGMVTYVDDDTDEEAKYETGSDFKPDEENYDDEDIKSELCA